MGKVPWHQSNHARVKSCSSVSRPGCNSHGFSCISCSIICWSLLSSTLEKNFLRRLSSIIPWYNPITEAHPPPFQKWEWPPGSATPQALSLTYTWHWRGMSAKTVQQCPEPSTSHGESHPHLPGCYYGISWLLQRLLPGIWVKLPRNLQTLPPPRRTCWSGSGVPQSALSTILFNYHTILPSIPQYPQSGSAFP